MLNNPDLPAQVPPDAFKNIHEMVALAGIEVGDSIRELGLYKFYYMGWSTLPSGLANEIRAVVNAYHSPPEDSQHLHPFSSAIEKGLVVGAILARNTLQYDSDYDVFAKRLTGQLRSLRLLLPRGGADLADIIKTTGGSFAQELRSEVDPALVTLDAEGHIHDVRDRQLLFENAVGYVGTSLLTKLLEIELRCIQPVDDAARFDIEDDIELLQSDFVLKGSDF
jgi:hypothetical protein